jgi:hypothetical protein
MRADQPSKGTGSGGFAMLFALAIAGCDSGDRGASGTIVAPAATPAAAPAPLRAAPGDTIGADRIERVAIQPPPANPTPAATMRPRRAFADPPLPPELQDDGGLMPLPPPPRK